MDAPARLHYMDNLRALAMMAGLLFHAALAYSPLIHPYFPTADRAQSAALDLGIWFLHLFRMPLFFLVAGFFAAMLVSKRGLGGMFRNRLKRIALPLILFLPLVNWALGYSTLDAAASVAHPSPVLKLVAEFSRMDTPPVLPPSTGHLWFLYYLLFFYLLIWSARSFELGWLGERLRALSPLRQLLYFPLLLLPALASVSAPHPAPESLLPHFWAFAFFGPFFAFGYLLFGHETLVAQYRAYLPRLFVGSVIMFAAFIYLLDGRAMNGEDFFASLLPAVFEAYVSVWMTVVCLTGGQAVLNRSHAWLRYLADASYWTYIAHLPVLFFIQYRLMDLDWPWGLKFSISVTATFALCLLSYSLLVRPTPLARLLSTRRALRPGPWFSS